MQRIGTAARQDIQHGIDKLANAVKVTLGPRGRNVVLDKKFGSPLSTKDGVTVAKEVELENHFENMGAQMVREVASKTSDVAGDGTTTATVLAQAIYREGLQQVTAGHNPMEIKRGVDQAVDAVVEALRSLSRDVKDRKEIAQVGAISANNDSAIGELIAEAMERVGKDGVITVEEGVVPGGGVAYLRSIQAVDKLQLGGERQVGAAIVKRALEEPTRQIALNAGVEGATVVQRLKTESGATGYDAATNTYVDLMEAGVIDPTKVSRTALQNAASVAGLMLTTEALVTELPEKPKAAPAGMHDAMGDMDF